MYKNILVPVVFDHDPSAEQALEVAKTLLASGGKTTLLHVVEEIPSYAASMIPRDIFKDSLKSSALELKAIAEKSAPDAATHIVSGHPNREILNHAENMGADCIIIASHKPGLEDYFLGSTAARIVRHARCNVHIMR